MVITEIIAIISSVTASIVTIISAIGGLISSFYKYKFRMKYPNSDFPVNKSEQPTVKVNDNYILNNKSNIASEDIPVLMDNSLGKDN